MEVYDKEKQKQGEKNTGQHDDLGVDPDQRAAEVADLEDQFAAPSAEKSGSGALGSKDLESAEESAEEPEPTSAGSTEENDDQIGEGFKDDDKPKKKGRFSRKQKGIGAIIASVLVTGTFGIFSFLQGPSAILHFGQLLNLNFEVGNETMSSRAGALYRWGRYPNQPEMRRVGIVGRKLTTTIDAKLTRTGYSTDVKGGRLNGIVAPDGKYIEIDPPGQSRARARQNWNSFRKTYNLRSSENIGALGSRYLKKAFGFNMGNILSPRRIFQDRAAKKTSVEEGRKKARAGALDKGRMATHDVDDDGRPVQDSGTTTEVSGGRKAAAKAIKTATYVALGCIAVNLADPESVEHKANVILPLMRGSARYLTIMGQMQKGNVDIEELGFVYQELFAKDENGKASSAFASAPMQSLAGQAPTGRDIPPEAHPVRSLNAFESMIGGLWDSLGFAQGAVGGACDFIQSSVGQALGWAVDIGLCIGTGFTSCAGKAVAQAAVIGKGMNFLVSLIAGDQTTACFNEVVESLDPEDEQIAGKTQIGGETVGACMAHGARLLANENMINFGGRELDNTESLALQNYINEQENERIQSQSLITRLFNPSERKSLVSIISLNLLQVAPSSSTQVFANTLLKSPFGAISSLFLATSGTVSAQSVENYDWGYNQFGFSLDELDSDLYDNPYENEAVIKDRLDEDETKDRIKQCFALELQDDYSLMPIEEEVRVTNRSKLSAGNCQDKSEEWTRIRFYILDSQIAESMNCYEGDDSSCQRFGFDASSSQTPTTPPQEGLETPPNMGGEIANGYYKMPDATQAEYVISSPDNNRCGSATLINTIYTVSKRWYAKYPNSKVRIGDLNAAAGHKSHMTGVDVDIYTVDKSAADMGGDTTEKSKELGRMFADTNVIKYIFYNDTAVQNDFNSYVQGKGLPSKMQSEDGHENHFHVRILDDYILKSSGGCSES